MSGMATPRETAREPAQDAAKPLFSYRPYWAHRFGTAPFLPMSRAEMEALGWDACDIVLVTGDAYVDHPSFGMAIIGRLLEAQGFRVGIIAQPDWQSADAFAALGKPNLYFGITGGNMDSMVNRYTSDRRLRHNDSYTPGGEGGKRPDRSVIVYAQRCREAYRDVPIVLGGIEASLRRIAHYDYWSDTVRRSMLLDAKADMLVFGMGERPVWEVADRLNRGERIRDIRDVRGTAFLINDREMQRHEADPARMVADRKVVVLPSYEEVAADKRAFALMSRSFQLETNPGNARPLAQRHGQRGVYYNPPAFPLEDGAGSGGASVSMDELYDLPFTRVPHPMYAEPIPGYETVKHSLVLMRGCFGGCTFCSITEHEGRVIQNRSAESVLREIRALRRQGDFRGTITDLGGPTANMYRLACKSPEI